MNATLDWYIIVVPAQERLRIAEENLAQSKLELKQRVDELGESIQQAKEQN